MSATLRRGPESANRSPSTTDLHELIERPASFLRLVAFHKLTERPGIQERCLENVSGASRIVRANRTVQLYADLHAVHHLVRAAIANLSRIKLLLSLAGVKQGHARLETKVALRKQMAGPDEQRVSGSPLLTKEMKGRATIQQCGKTVTVQLKLTSPNMMIGKAQAERAPQALVLSASLHGYSLTARYMVE